MTADTRRSSVLHPQMDLGEAMFQLVLVDNSGYESEVIASLPHEYATAEAGRADLRDIELHKPSDRFASWEVWSTDRIAGRDDTADETGQRLRGDPAERLRVMNAALRDVWRLALQWQRHDDTEQQAGDIFTALAPLAAWEAEHLPIAERLLAPPRPARCPATVGDGPTARPMHPDGECQRGHQ